MKIIVFFLIAGFMTVSASSYSQRITMKGNNIPFERVVEMIREQTGYSVFTSKRLLRDAKNIHIDVVDLPLEEFLERITADQAIDFQLEDKTISLSRAVIPREPQRVQVQANYQTQMQQVQLEGLVKSSESGELLQGVTVRVKGTNQATTTDAKGRFKLTVSAKIDAEGQVVMPVLVFSYVGMKSQEIVAASSRPLEVLLVSSSDAIKDVVVTGIYQRDQESFTGSSSTFTGKELRRIGNFNVLQSLKTLDPSFAIIESEQFGSDPNRMPDVEIRGKSSVIGLTDEFAMNPNQPLFILDGFESSLAQIADLSMDQVESITVLKDAAAAAIYGSKAANGVVVVETKRPEAGQLRINYSLSGNVGIADLTDYNLMNAVEKLQFEFLSGFYGGRNADGAINPGPNLNNEALYYERLKEVNRGVDTYWANEPLRTAITQRHTLFAEGGDETLRYSLTFNHGITQGVMKGSDRQVTGGSVRLLYRKGNLSLSNTLGVDHVIANRETTPFSDYVRANPYHRKYDELGNIKVVLEDFRVTASNLDPIYSPLYNDANLNIDQEGTLGLTNNFELEWKILPELRARGRFGLRMNRLNNELFRSPFNTESISLNEFQRGRYLETNGKTQQYDGDASLTYGKVFNERHILNVVAGLKLEQSSRRQSAFEVRGFLDDEFANPNFALSYPDGQRASYLESKRRGAGLFATAGYSFDRRYMVDLTLRSDGSSVYGSERQFSTIWSMGLAWNLHQESFLAGHDWFKQLRLRGSVGNPGNQNFDDYISMRIYRYNNNNRNPFGASTVLDNFGNRNLKWQTTLDKNIGFDLTTWNNRWRFVADVFQKSTDPLLVFIALPSSSGIKQVPINLGAQITKGFTFDMSYLAINKQDWTWRWSLNGRHLNAEYQNIGAQLEHFNESNRSRSLARFYDGGSPSDLWAVRSAGIDPASGREIFIKKNGEQTFVHNYEDEVVVGNSDPNLEGVLGTSLTYKGFYASAYLRYRVGGQAFMRTLYDKVENITSRTTALNQDKRALYDRWKEPGDQAKFKAISRSEYTPMSSRFVADNDRLIGESFSLGYESTQAPWLRQIRASSFQFKVYMNDIFHISTIKNERGIDYPFARTVSFTASVRF